MFLLPLVAGQQQFFVYNFTDNDLTNFSFTEINRSWALNLSLHKFMTPEKAQLLIDTKPLVNQTLLQYKYDVNTSYVSTDYVAWNNWLNGSVLDSRSTGGTHEFNATFYITFDRLINDDIIWRISYSSDAAVSVNVSVYNYSLGDYDRKYTQIGTRLAGDECHIAYINFSRDYLMNNRLLLDIHFSHEPGPQAPTFCDDTSGGGGVYRLLHSDIMLANTYPNISIQTPDGGVLYSNTTMSDAETNMVINLNSDVLSDYMSALNCTIDSNFECNTEIYFNLTSNYGKLSISSLNITYSPYYFSYPTEQLLETQDFDFYAVLSNITNVTDMNAALDYNGTLYSLTKTVYTNYINFSTDVSIPFIQTDDLIYNYSFYIDYNYTFADKANESYTSKVFNQTVYRILVDECVNATFRVINVSIRNKTSNALVTADLEWAVNYWVTEGLFRNYSTSQTTVSTAGICKYPNWTNITSTFLFEYTRDNTIYDYSVYNLGLLNRTHLINLYTQEGTTQTLFTVIDVDDNPLAEAYIHILRYDVGNNTYSTTEILKTDSQGQALGNIVLGTTFYNFLIYYQGSLVHTEEAVKMLVTTRTFTVDLVGSQYFNTFQDSLGIVHNLIFNNVTNNFVFTWSQGTGVVHYACLEVTKTNRTNRYELVDTCQESTSGTILYNVGTPRDGDEFIATSYFKYDDIHTGRTRSYKIEDVVSFFHINSQLSLFIGIIIILLLFLIGIPVPGLSISLLGIGMILCSYLGLWVLTSLQLGSIVFLIIIQLFVMRDR